MQKGKDVCVIKKIERMKNARIASCGDWALIKDNRTQCAGSSLCAQAKLLSAGIQKPLRSYRFKDNQRLTCYVLHLNYYCLPRSQI